MSELTSVTILQFTVSELYQVDYFLLALCVVLLCVDCFWGIMKLLLLV